MMISHGLLGVPTCDTKWIKLIHCTAIWDVVETIWANKWRQDFACQHYSYSIHRFSVFAKRSPYCRRSEYWIIKQQKIRHVDSVWPAWWVQIHHVVWGIIEHIGRHGGVFLAHLEICPWPAQPSLFNHHQRNILQGTHYFLWIFYYWLMVRNNWFRMR